MSFSYFKIKISKVYYYCLIEVRQIFVDTSVVKNNKQIVLTLFNSIVKNIKSYKI